FDMCTKTSLAQGGCKWKQIVEQGFTSCDHGYAGRMARGILHDLLHGMDRMLGGIPTVLHITPSAAHIATRQADEVSSLSCESTLALQRMEALHHRQMLAISSHCTKGCSGGRLVHGRTKKAHTGPSSKNPWIT